MDRRSFTTEVEMTSSEYHGLLPCSWGINGSQYSIWTNESKDEGFGAIAGHLRFTPVKAVRVGYTSVFKATLMLEFVEIDHRCNLGGWNSFIDLDTQEFIRVNIYKEFNFDEMLDSNWVWSEIKETKHE